MDNEIRKLQEERNSGRVALGAKAGFDSDIYGDAESDQAKYSKFAHNEDMDLEGGDGMEEDDDNSSSFRSSHPSSINPSRELLNESIGRDDDLSLEYRSQYGTGLVNTRIADRETQVRKLYLFAFPNSHI